ncbi:MAG: YihY/virulence factor BrkB family protein, partial [Planctomycetota bacterium]
MKRIANRIVRFTTRDIWRIRASDLSKWRFALLQYLRIFILAVRGFASDSCSLRASALTFYTILSIVPVVAMGFGIAKGFGMEKVLREQITGSLKGHEEVANNIIKFSERLLQNARGGLVAGVGIAVLLWTVIKVLGNIEKSFNHIWGVERPRGIIRRFTDYLSIMLVCPILLVMSSGITVMLRTHVATIVEKFDQLGLGALTLILFVLLNLVPLILGWAVFALVYIFIPNTKVNVKSGIVAGIAAGTLFQIVQMLYVGFQVGVTNYSAVYGSFAALPLFLIWLQLSWLVVLFGAELSFAHQNVETYEFEPDCMAASNHFKRLISLRTAQHLIRNFADGGKPRTASEISHAFGAPIRLVNEILNKLVSGGVLSEARMGESR